MIFVAESDSSWRSLCGHFVIEAKSVNESRRYYCYVNGVARHVGADMWDAAGWCCDQVTVQ